LAQDRERKNDKNNPLAWVSITKTQLAGLDDISVIIDFSEYLFFVGCFFEHPPGQFDQSADGSVFEADEFFVSVLFSCFHGYGKYAILYKGLHYFAVFETGHRKTGAIRRCKNVLKR